MFGSIGMSELVVIFVIALIVFGPRKLPELGRTLGRTMGEFKKATTQFQQTLEEEVRLDAAQHATPPYTVTPAVVAPDFSDQLSRSAAGESLEPPAPHAQPAPEAPTEHAPHS